MEWGRGGMGAVNVWRGGEGGGGGAEGSKWGGRGTVGWRS